ncbi:MAG TPA: ABC transporter substrate-binding protein, partial [Nitrolancea sp.]
MEDQGLRNLYNQALSGALSRREVLKRAAALGLAAPAIAALLAACGSSSNKTATSASSQSTAASTSA